MSLNRLLSDRCRILTRSVDETAKTSRESWTAQSADVPCRFLTRIAGNVLVDAGSKNTQNTTIFRVTFVLRKSAVVSPRDRIRRNGRVYSVLEVVSARDATKERFKNAICELVA